MSKLNIRRSLAKAILFSAISSMAIIKTSYGADIVQLPSMNLGDVNFHDGVAGPGKIAMLLSDNYRGKSFNNANGDKLPGNNDLNVDVLLSQFAFISNTKILGGYYGAEVLLPLVHVNAQTSLAGLPNESETGVGDIIFSPFLLQWTDSTLFGKPYSHRLNFLFNAPTGSYDKNKAVNSGYNYWRFNPYYAGTLQLTPKIATSFRLHYLWSDKNDDPNPIIANKDTQAGTAFHMNFATGYALTPQLHLGVAGYYLKQLSDDKIDGVRQANSREQVFGIGPALQYFTKGGMFELNAYVESEAENRTEGNKIVARYRWLF